MGVGCGTFQLGSVGSVDRVVLSGFSLFVGSLDRNVVLKTTFNEEHYLQLQGTAMGTKMAPSYANLFMGHLEPRLIQTNEKKPY